MEVIFDLTGNKASLSYNGETIKKDIKITKISDYWKMTSISYYINDDWKWVVSWKVYADQEQFIGFDEYKINKNPKKDPWTTMAKWSYIRYPQRGTVQTTNVHRINYKPNLFPKVNGIKVTVNNSSWGDWNTENFVEGYYY